MAVRGDKKEGGGKVSTYMVACDELNPAHLLMSGNIGQCVHVPF